MAVFFTNVDDAQEMLFEMVQNSFYSKEARILVVSMEKAYGMVKAGPTSTGCVCMYLFFNQRCAVPNMDQYIYYPF